MERVLGVDIGGSKALCGLVGADGVIVRTFGEALAPGCGAEGMMEAVLRCGAKVLEGERPDAVGVTVPGLANAKNGVWGYAPFSGITNLPIAARLAEAFGAPAYVENDVNACALAEMRFGSCKAVRDFVWVTVSNGVGGAVVAGGRLVTGSGGNAGEIGHLVVEEDPIKARRCGCGRLGCLEAMAAGPGIAARYGVPGVTARDIAELARKGEEKAISVMKETGVYLGKGLAMCATLLNPARVVLGGGVAQSFDLFDPAMIEALRARVFSQGNAELEVETTALGYHAALLGAATLALTEWRGAA